jgi:hypothetical protein
VAKAHVTRKVAHTLTVVEDFRCESIALALEELATTRAGGDTASILTAVLKVVQRLLVSAGVAYGKDPRGVPWCISGAASWSDPARMTAMIPHILIWLTLCGVILGVTDKIYLHRVKDFRREKTANRILRSSWV